MSAPSTQHRHLPIPWLGTLVDRWFRPQTRTETRLDVPFEAHAARVELLNAEGFAQRHNAVREALSAGLPLHEIEAALDWADLRRNAALNA